MTCSANMGFPWALGAIPDPACLNDGHQTEVVHLHGPASTGECWGCRELWNPKIKWLSGLASHIGRQTHVFEIVFVVSRDFKSLWKHASCHHICPPELHFSHFTRGKFFDVRWFWALPNYPPNPWRYAISSANTLPSKLRGSGTRPQDFVCFSSPWNCYARIFELVFSSKMFWGGGWGCQRMHVCYIES